MANLQLFFEFRKWQNGAKGTKDMISCLTFKKTCLS